MLDVKRPHLIGDAQSMEKHDGVARRPGAVDTHGKVTPSLVVTVMSCAGAAVGAWRDSTGVP